MTTITKLIIAAAAIVVAFGTSIAVAQRNYNPKTVETIEGKVLSVKKTTSPKGRGSGVHLILQAQKETISVRLGPAWYLEKQTPRVGANDTVIVTGSRVMIKGQPAIIAAQIKKGNNTLKLRDDNGVPLWSRARRGNR